MKVYLASRGEKHEGSTIIGVFSTFQLAVDYALNDYASSGWHEDESRKGKETVDELACKAYFEIGCDYWAVTERIVDELVNHLSGE